MRLLLLPLAFLALGVALGSWRVVIAPVLVSAVIALFLVLNNGWYGAGWGDGGIELNLLAAASSVVAAAVGVALRKIFGPRA